MAWFGLFSLKVFYSAHYFSVEVFKPWLFLEWFWFNTIFAFYNFAILFVSSFSVILVSALWVIYLLSCIMESIWKASLIFHPCLFANILKLFIIVLQQNLKQSNSKKILSRWWRRRVRFAYRFWKERERLYPWSLIRPLLHRYSSPLLLVRTCVFKPSVVKPYFAQNC